MKKFIILFCLGILLAGCAPQAAVTSEVAVTDTLVPSPTARPTPIPMLPASVPPLVGLDLTFQTPGDFSAYADKLFSQLLVDENGNGFEDEVNAMFTQNGLSLDFQSNKDFAASVVQACKTIHNHTFKDAQGKEFEVTGIEFAIGNGKWLVAVRTAEGLLTVDGGQGYPVEFTDGTLTDIVDWVYLLVPGSDTMMATVDAAGKMKLVERVVEEKKYTSCADPELMAEVLSDGALALGYEENTSIIDQILPGLAKKLKEIGVGFGYAKEDGGVDMSGGYYYGWREVSLRGRAGFSKNDVVICNYVLTPRGVQLPLIRGYTKNGEFRQLGNMAGPYDESSGKSTIFETASLSEMREALNTIPVGTPLVVGVQTTLGVETVSEIDGDLSKFMLGNWHMVADLIQAMGGDAYIQRMHDGEGSPSKMTEQLDLAKGDIGLLSHYIKVIKYLSENN